MIKEVPLIARMIVIEYIISQEKKNKDTSYYNSDLDRECEYCLNTTAWD